MLEQMVVFFFQTLSKNCSFVTFASFFESAGCC